MLLFYYINLVKIKMFWLSRLRLLQRSPAKCFAIRAFFSKKNRGAEAVSATNCDSSKTAPASLEEPLRSSPAKYEGFTCVWSLPTYHQKVRAHPGAIALNFFAHQEFRFHLSMYDG